jgi:hypothetical protein
MLRLDLHVHSCFSFDGFMSPKTIINAAKKRCLSGVAVTDHGTIEGGLRTLAENDDDDFLVIVGTEIHSEIGDIIGLFLEEEITSRESKEIVSQIHQQGGIAILPHPYHHHHLPLPGNLLASLDAVEVRNGRVKDYAERALAEVVSMHHLATTGGSDAHLPWEVGRVWTEIEGKGEDTKDVKEAILRRCSQPSGYAGYPPSLAILLSKVMKRYRRISKALKEKPLLRSSY